MEKEEDRQWWDMWELGTTSVKLFVPPQIVEEQINMEYE